MNYAKKILGSLALAIAVFVIVPTLTAKAEGLNGLVLNEDSQWYYFVDGDINYGYTGLVNDETVGWWLVSEGRVAFEYTGLWGDPNYGWWLVSGGRVAFEYTGLWGDPNYGWWLVSEGRVAFEYTGLWGDPNYGWWLVSEGRVAFEYTGLWGDPNYGWWLVGEGHVAFEYTGLWNDPVCGWWLVGEGHVAFEYTGLWNDPVCGWWLVSEGSVAFGYTGLWNDPVCGWWLVGGGSVAFGYTGLWGDPNYGWWYVEGGTVGFGYTGIVTNEYGTWYCTGGMLNFGYTGIITVDGVQYNVVGGLVTGPVGDGNTEGGNTEGTYQTGARITGAIAPDGFEGSCGIYIILSSTNPDYALTVVEDAAGGCNLVMSKLTGDESQKFEVRKYNGLYFLASMKYYTEDGTSANNKWFVNTNNDGWNPATANHADNVNVVASGEGHNQQWVVAETATPGEYTFMIYRTDAYEEYMSVEGGVAEGVNVQAGGEGSTTLTLSLAFPYTKTLEDGSYQFSLSGEAGLALAIDNASMKDYRDLVASELTASGDQLFDVKCVDALKGIYTIQNAQSKKYFQIRDGKIDIGTDIVQVEKTGLSAQEWYIQKRVDGTYSIINTQSNQALTVSGGSVFQSVGNDQAGQKFVVSAAEEDTEALDAGVYSIGGKYYRLSYVGNGYYNIYSLSDSGYMIASSAGVLYGSNIDTAAAKWRVIQSGSQYAFQSVANGNYLDFNRGLVTGRTLVDAVDVTSMMGDYTQKFDLSVLTTLDSGYEGIQVVKRMNALGLARADFMNPTARISEIEARVEAGLSGLPTEVVRFTGNTVAELNDFMKANMGKVVQLTQDVQVAPKMGSNDSGTWVITDGSIRIPSNVVLDGNGHKLVQACTDAELPGAGIVFFYIDEADNYRQVTSENCGVINLTSTIPYEYNTLNAWGADKILIENNTFQNAGYYSILINDRMEDGSGGYYLNATSIGRIKNNVIGNNDTDSLGVYGNNDSLIIDGNTVSGSGDYGINVSCLRDGEPIRVEEEIDGPHDIIVKNNNVSEAEKCAMYYVGAYQVYVTGNTLHDSQLEGVCFDSGCIGCYFAGNEVFRTSLAGRLPGVSIDNGIYNIVDNNIVHNNGNAGIKIVRAGYGNIIVNNTCYDNNANVTSEKGNLGISIEVKVVNPEEEPEYVTVLDATGSDANVVYNNTVYGVHYQGIAISVDEEENGAVNRNNVVRYNRVTAYTEYPLVDFSSYDNVIRDNVVTK